MRILSLVAALLLLSSPSYAAVGPLVNAVPSAISTGGSWQAMFPANQNRSTLWVMNYASATTQNIGTAESLFIAFSSTAPTNLNTAVELTPGGSLVMTGPYVSQQPVWVYGATSAHKFYGAQSQ